jgi:hypothetical protein
MPYKVYVCGPGKDWDDDRGKPSKYLSEQAAVMECPREAEHCYGPSGYVDWHDWADRRRKTHRQRKCECGYYLLMELKPKRTKKAKPTV